MVYGGVREDTYREVSTNGSQEEQCFCVDVGGIVDAIGN
jgi:hypothetical protein